MRVVEACGFPAAYRCYLVCSTPRPCCCDRVQAANIGIFLLAVLRAADLQLSAGEDSESDSGICIVLDGVKVGLLPMSSRDGRVCLIMRGSSREARLVVAGGRSRTVF